MATAEYYCRTWIFYEANGPAAHETYPLGSTVTIGTQKDGSFMLAWADVQDILHVLVGLALENGNLSAISAKDLSTDEVWVVEIKAAGKQEIHATLSSSSGEGNLTGAWGAEAPPRPDEGQPS